MDENKHSKELKALSHAITDALLQNDEVMGMLSELKKRNVVDPNALMGLAFRVSDLLEIYDVSLSEADDELSKAFDENEAGARPKKLLPKRETQPLLMDGHELTDNEVAFQEWMTENFDETDWLKGMGLTW